MDNRKLDTLSSVRRRRYIKRALFVVAWVCGTTVVTILVGPRDNAPGPLEVLTVQPAHATPTVPDPLAVVGERVEAQETTDNIRTLQAAALQEAAREAATTTTTVVRAPAPRPAVAPRSLSGDGCGGWRDLVDDYAWDVTKACRILLCESGGDPTNYNGRSAGIPWSVNRASGLWQHLPAPANWQDPYVSTALAWSKYSARGWSPWVCS